MPDRGVRDSGSDRRLAGDAAERRTGDGQRRGVHVDDMTRFSSAHQFQVFLELVPGERSSGEKRRIGRIMKAGNSRAWYLLVEAGWRLLRSKLPETAALLAWGTQDRRPPGQPHSRSRAGSSPRRDPLVR